MPERLLSKHSFLTCLLILQRGCTGMLKQLILESMQFVWMSSWLPWVIDHLLLCCVHVLVFINWHCYWHWNAGVVQVWPCKSSPYHFLPRDGSAAPALVVRPTDFSLYVTTLWKSQYPRTLNIASKPLELVSFQLHVESISGMLLKQDILQICETPCASPAKNVLLHMCQTLVLVSYPNLLKVSDEDEQ